MSVPVQKLEVAEIPGFHCHWFRGSQDRIQRALNAGYTFVDPKEVHLNNVSLGGDSAESGNTDLGSRVSVVGGGIEEGSNQATRMYLMKIPMELRNQDLESMEQRSENIVRALNAGTIGKEGAEDGREVNNRYVGSTTKLPEMFRKKPRR